VRLEVVQRRQVDGQLVVGHRAQATRRLPLLVQLVQDRKRLAPEPLPAEQPVAELVVDGLAAEAGRREVVADLLLERRRLESVVLAGVDRHAVLGTALPAGQDGLAVHTRRIAGIDHGNDRDLEPLGKLKVAGVVRRHGHDGSRAVGDQHVIGNPNRHFLVVDRIDGGRARKHARLFLVLLPFAVTASGGPGAVGFDRRLLFRSGQAFDEGMLRRDNHIGRSEQRIRTRGVDPQHFVARLAGVA